MPLLLMGLSSLLVGCGHQPRSSGQTTHSLAAKPTKAPTPSPSEAGDIEKETTPMTDSAHVFVGSKEGWLRAYLVHPESESFTPRGATHLDHEVSFFALAPDGRTLFVSYDGGVSAYDYDRNAQAFTLLGRTETHGGGTHVAVAPSGEQILVAHYAANLVSLVRYAPQAGLATAQELSPGEKAHQIGISRDGRFVYVPCLGSDHIAQYRLEAAAGLTPQPTASVPAEGGPRHMAFHPSAPLAYVLTEKSSQIHVFDLDADSGSLTPREAASVFTRDDALDHWSSDVQLTPDGHRLYAVNRNPSEVVHFDVQEDGTLERRSLSPLSAPVRAFAMDPKGKYLLLGGSDGRLLREDIDPATGKLTQRSVLETLGNIRQTVISYR